MAEIVKWSTSMTACGMSRDDVWALSAEEISPPEVLSLYYRCIIAVLNLISHGRFLSYSFCMFCMFYDLHSQLRLPPSISDIRYPIFDIRYFLSLSVTALISHTHSQYISNCRRMGNDRLDVKFTVPMSHRRHHGPS